jgi:hypothetical protein
MYDGCMPEIHVRYSGWLPRGQPSRFTSEGGGTKISHRVGAFRTSGRSCGHNLVSSSTDDSPVTHKRLAMVFYAYSVDATCDNSRERPQQLSDLGRGPGVSSSRSTSPIGSFRLMRFQGGHAALQSGFFGPHVVDGPIVHWRV